MEIAELKSHGEDTVEMKILREINRWQDNDLGNE